MPKLPEPEFYAFRWLQWQAFGLAVYAALAWLNPPLLGYLGNLKAITPVWFVAVYVLQALVSVALTYRRYALARRQGFVDLEAYCLKTHGTRTFRKDRTYAAGSVSRAAQDDPVPAPNPAVFTQLWALGLIPVALLAFNITGARSSFWLIGVPGLVVLTAGVTLIFLGVKRQHDDYQEEAQPVLFSLTSRPPIPHHPPHDAAAAAEEAAWSSRGNRFGIDYERKQREAQRIRRELPALEALHLKAFGRYVAERDFDGTVDRKQLRQGYVWNVLQSKPQDISDLKHSKRPEILSLLTGAGLTIDPE